MPRMGRFVSELGAQAVPEDAEFCEPERWPDLDWERLGHTHALQKAVFDRVVPPAEHTTSESWRDATQRYQDHLLRRQIRSEDHTSELPSLMRNSYAVLHLTK